MSRVLPIAVAAAGLASAGCAREGTPAPSAAPRSVLLITLDTLRADHLGAYGYGPAETPHLDRFAREGLRFDHAMSAVPLTLPSHATILSGRWPQHHGLRMNGAGSLPGEVPTLASVFGGAGYRTGAFVGAFVLDRRFGLARGFELYDDEIPRDPTAPEGLEAERPGREVVDRALAWLGQSDGRPFFLWVHLFDAHAPYDPPEPFRSRHADQPYDGEVAEVDTQVGRLLAELERRGLRQRTVVAILADHGEGLGDHGELTHGLRLYEPTIRVPWLLGAPGLGPAVVMAPVSTADVAPTISALAGVSFPRQDLDGRNLAPDLLAGTAPPAGDLYAETRYPAVFGWTPLSAVRRGRFKYIASARPELFDLAADPTEASNLRTTERRAAADLTARLATLTRFSRESAPTAGDDADTKARLASLGYVGSGAEGSDPAARSEPDDTLALFRQFELAHWALLGGRPQEAAERLEALVAADPGNPVFRASLGEAARKSGHLRRAAELYRQATAAAPDDPQNWYNLAVTLREGGEPREAAKALTEALRLDPGHAEAHNTLGILHIFEGDLAAARDELSRAVELDPRNTAAQNNLGNALRALGRMDEAERHYREAIRLAPRYADPLNGLGVLLVERNRPAEAVPFLDRALALAPGFHEVQLNRGVALQALGDLPAAIAAYRSFLNASASDPGFSDQRRVARELVARLSGSMPGRPTAGGR